MMPDMNNEGPSNTSPNDTFGAVLERRMQRRAVLRGGLGAAAIAFLKPHVGTAASSSPASSSSPVIGFTSVPVSFRDEVVVPPGYRARVLIAWGDPISDGPAFRQDASHSAADQERQFGMHCDGMHYFPLSRGRTEGGLLVVNHEYTDEGLLHADGLANWSAEKVRKSQAAHGVSIVEIRRERSRRRREDDDGWRVVRPSRYARRITAYTPMELTGPARGAEGMRTSADPQGHIVLGTLNNCSNGFTPWGTYLACEENWHFYFASSDKSYKPAPGSAEARYGLRANGLGFRWHEFDLRFDLSRDPNEPHRFGWVVEIDPFDPTSRPRKRTALGRFKHEGACITLAADGRVVAYMGDDERFEYVYKFVSRDVFRPGERARNANLLEEGTLYVARFNADGSGEWLELVHGRRGLDESGSNPLGLKFVSQADVLIRTRQAADAVGATKMDRPEWVAVHPETGEVYVTLTNNSARQAEQVDAANPRARNIYGHIVRWREADGDAAAVRFTWDVFVQAGDPSHPQGKATAEDQGIRGDLFGSPDGLRFDRDGRLWIQTDAAGASIQKPDGTPTAAYANIGHNQMLCADVRTREIRRFLTGPRGCEVTGNASTPDGRTMFVCIQHPGEPDDGSTFNDPARPKRFSSWPDGEAGGRPRSAVVVITKDDGGVIGT